MLCSKHIYSAVIDATTQLILLHVIAEGKVFASGTDNIVKAVVGEIELYEKIKTCINNNLTTENVRYGNTQKLAYNLLPCSPFCLFISLSLYVQLLQYC